VEPVEAVQPAHPVQPVGHQHRLLAESRAFFAARAANWEERYPDDTPIYEAAIAALTPRVGGTALDLGCGTGRALPILRAAIGPDGHVIGIDATPEMLAEVVRRGRSGCALLILGDAARVPVADRCCDAIFAAGLLHHLADPIAGLREVTRIARPGARLALFHPIGRVALAARHGSYPDADDIRGEVRIRAALAATGWRPELIDDGDERYLVVAQLA
jgi:SAM-dependent methyltransferase